MPAISVIVPTRLRNHLLPRALRSLLAQSFEDYEILVVDDNPPGNRLTEVSALADYLQHPKIRVLPHDQPRNAATARNVALRAARGEWITFLDDDDAYQPTKLEKQWKRAQETHLPLGLCGITYHLSRRRRQCQVSECEFARKDLLLNYRALPSLFHRSTDGRVLFDEQLSAGEDSHYFFKLLHHYQVDRIFNVPEPLVDIYPQVGPRVNHNALGLWQAAEAIYREFAPAYGPQAAESFLLRARLGYLKLQKGCWGEMVCVAWTLLRRRGWQDARFIINAFCLKLPGAKRWLVS